MLSLTTKTPLSSGNQGCSKGEGSTLYKEVPSSQRKEFFSEKNRTLRGQQILSGVTLLSWGSCLEPCVRILEHYPDLVGRYSVID